MSLFEVFLVRWKSSDVREAPAGPRGLVLDMSTLTAALPDTPLIVEELLLEADGLSASGALDHEVDALITTALELLTGGPQR